MSRIIQAADLFCGAGGTSLGLGRACESLGVDIDLVAVNHWPKAVATHELNHPWATHHCATMEALDPRKAVPGGKLDLIVAGVECTHHSKARGGRPMSDQSRASAWHVAHWAEKLRVNHILIENVPDFMTWGPLDENNRPIKERKGDTFRAFIGALESMGYIVEHRILNCANYGDPTTRQRFFLQAKLGSSQIDWPDHTHSDDKDDDLLPWRTAREIINWNDLGTSIFTRKKPLAPRTIARIEAGIKRFCGESAEPFLVILKGRSSVRSIDAPVPTITAGARHLAVAQPFFVQFYGTNTVRSIDRPAPTVTANGQHTGLATPFILPHDQFPQKNGLSLVDSVDEPMRTVTAHNGADNYLVSPFLIPHYGERPGQDPRTHSVDEPVPTVTATKGAGSLVSPSSRITSQGQKIDIFFRMLQPDELARAQGFPDEFQFVGNKGDVVRQIGNAVPVGTAQQLCRAILQEAA